MFKWFWNTFSLGSPDSLVNFQFWLADFEFSRASGASKYCEAVEFWMKTKMKII